MIFKKKVDREEFKKLTYPHMKLLHNMALKYCGNSHDAQDIVQETFLMAFDKFHQLRDKSKCKPWLLRILKKWVKNLVILIRFSWRLSLKMSGRPGKK